MLLTEAHRPSPPSTTTCCPLLFPVAMPRHKIQHHHHTGSDEAAGAKIWAVYVAEAEKYDKALVENWRSDMEGILIFAGLFSASLTAFIIESYKTLRPDQGEIIIALLTQISQSSISPNATSVEVPAGFSPAPISVICNVWWFISLGLSLSSALVATLVEQWARNFLQKTDIRPSPIVRARIFSYLYYGMQRFQMHTVVEVVPLLLHTSLLLFFFGLVAFLLPINRAVATIVAGLLATVTTIYSFLTVLPILYPDCPYWTPMSGCIWRATKIFASVTAARRPVPRTPDAEPGQLISDASKPPDTIVEAISSFATLDSAERTERDARALCWTVKSLAEDDELELFLEGIPDLIYDAGNHRRYTYDERIKLLVNDPEIHLGSRMVDMIQKSDSGLLPTSAQARRLTSCLKAIWAVARLATKDSSYPQPFDSIDESEMYSEFIRQNPSLQHYSASAFAMVRWSRLCSRTAWINEGLRLLRECDTVLRRNKIPNIRPTVQHLKVLLPKWPYPSNRSTNHEFAQWINQTIRQVELMKRSLRNKPFDIGLRFLTDSSLQDSLPYQFRLTWETFKPEIAAQPNYGLLTIEQIFERLLSTHCPDFGSPSVQDFDKLLGVLFPLWQRFPDPDSKFVSKIIAYINARSCDDCSVPCAPQL
ncbi:hypothetical protein DFH09DRAFT_970213 [Mycena vulgaris]|nr:hypothetical protein DFH09DRAFT_970213 [Mycena vulgaris]